jgi:ribosomal protein S18 acetylase RimI-like enzyme
VCRYVGLDLYYVAVLEGRVLGYGLLRGWDEGYSIPSLGIVLHPSMHGKGLGRAFMHFLHAAARQCGSTKVRLKVDRDNLRAINLYKTFGYRFEPLDETEQLIGILSLG